MSVKDVRFGKPVIVPVPKLCHRVDVKTTKERNNIEGCNDTHRFVKSEKQYYNMARENKFQGNRRKK
jgi:hypothetical protein